MNRTCTAGNRRDRTRIGGHLLLIAVLAICFCALWTAARAETAEAYTTPEYDVVIDVHKNYSFDYTETITVDYGDYAQHGIFRNIPLDAAYRIRCCEPI